MDRGTIDNEKFISLIEPNPCLWDTTHRDYSDRKRKRQCWFEVSVKMNDAFQGMTLGQKNEYAKYLQKKWKNLRNSFSRELARQRKQKKGSGETWKTYVFFDQMSFLMGHTPNIQVPSNLTENIEHSDNDPLEGEEDDASLSSISEPVYKKLKPSREALNSQMNEMVRQNFQLNGHQMEQDEDRLFLLSLLGDFKRLPIDKKMDVKLTIIQAMKQAMFPSQCAPIYSPAEHSIANQAYSSSTFHCDVKTSDSPQSDY